MSILAALRRHPLVSSFVLARSVLTAQLMHLCFTGAFITFEPALVQPQVGDR